MTEGHDLLLFDDDARNAKLIKASFKKKFNITWVKNEGELDNEIRDDFKVIVTDVKIQGTDKKGYQIIEDIRKKYKISRIPVVVYSGVVNVDQIEKERGRLFFGYVDKGKEDFADELLQKCIEAELEKDNITSHRYFETRFQMLGKLNEPLDTLDLSNHLSFLGDASSLKTIKHLIAQMKNPEMEEDILDALEDLSWELIKRFEKEQNENI